MKVVIIGLIVFLLLITSVMSFFYAQGLARDQIRVKDVALIEKFLTAYKTNEGAYPPSANGAPTSWGNYLEALPQAPQADGKCSAIDNKYNYVVLNSGQSYKLTFCLGHVSSGFTSGKNIIESKP